MGPVITVESMQGNTPAAWMAAMRWRNPAPIMLQSARARALKHGIAFTITAADIESVWPRDSRCPVFGTLFSQGGEGRGPKPHSATLDRIVPNLGYIPGNIAIISHKANAIKQNACAAEVQAVADWLAEQEGMAR